MKNLQNLKGAKALNKKEQQSINGGGEGPFITCDNQVTITGGPTCPTQENIDAICLEIGGTVPGGCNCDPANEQLF